MGRHPNLAWLWVLTLSVLLACGKNPWGYTVPTQYSIDGVKRVTEGINGDDPATWGQSRYVITPTSRLLLRFESLSDHVPDIVTANGKKVTIQMTLSSATQLTAALADLKLCPITRSWMMLASWDLAHPFMGGEAWSTRGGDYDSAGCTLPSQLAGSTLTLEYDMTSWYINYPKGRGTNYGVIAVITQNFEIEGDPSGSHSPRIGFEE